MIPAVNPDWIPFHRRYTLDALGATTRKTQIIPASVSEHYAPVGQLFNGISIDNQSSEDFDIELNGQTDRAIFVASKGLKVFEGKSFEYSNFGVYNRSATASSDNEVYVTVYKLLPHEF